MVGSGLTTCRSKAEVRWVFVRVGFRSVSALLVHGGVPLLARSAKGVFAIGLVALLAACAQTSGPIGGEPLIDGTGPTPDAVPTPTPAQDCLAPSTVVTAVAGDAPGPVCLRRGDHLTVKTSASANQPW